MPFQGSSLDSAATLFDELGEEYSNVYEVNELHLKNLRKLIPMLSIGSTVLDLGCGTGRPTSFMLNQAGMRVIGVDVSLTMIEAARRNVPRATFYHMDVIDYQPRIKFDAVVSTFAFLQMPTNQIRALAYKVAHWLKPRGILLFSSVDFTEVERAPEFPPDPSGEWLWHNFMGRIVKDNIFSMGDWIKIFRQTGIALLQINASVFDSRPGEYVAEPEYFIFGQKNLELATLGPYLHPYQHTSSSSGDLSAWLNLQSYWNLKDPGFFCEVLGLSNTTARQTSSFHEIQAILKQQEHTYGVLVHPWLLDTELPRSRSIKSAVDFVRARPYNRIAILQAAPNNEIMRIVNIVSRSIGRPQHHHGALLKEAIDKLYSEGIKSVRLELVDGALEFGTPLIEGNMSAGLAEIISKIWFQPRVSIVRELIEYELRRYSANQIDMGCNPRCIGFDCVLLVVQA